MKPHPGLCPGEVAFVQADELCVMLHAVGDGAGREPGAPRRGRHDQRRERSGTVHKSRDF
jgi:hypothetical protein